MNTISAEQFKKVYGSDVANKFAAIQEQPGYLSRVGSELGSAYKGLQKTTERGAELMGEGKEVQGAVMSGLGAPAAFIRGAFSPITAAISPIIQKGLEASGVMGNEEVQSKLASLDAWAKAHPDAAENLKNTLEIGLTLAGARSGKEAIKIGEKGLTKAGELGEKGLTKAKTAIKPVTMAVEPYVSEAKRIPANIATNIAEKKAVEQSIKQLPLKAQTAVRDGVDIFDIKDIYKIPKTIKPDAKKLADDVIKFAGRETDIDPIRLVGEPIVKRMRAFETTKQSIGKKLGSVADDLGGVTTKEAYPSLFKSLKNVPGLSGLKVNKKGILDFKDTVLASSETLSDRKAIQRIFTNAIKSGTGKQKHLLRQELFEVLGGKKKGGLVLTATQEKAYNAIRKGLSDVLETKNGQYKALSGQYRKVTQPLEAMRRLIAKKYPDATEDILEMNAGLLARRLTSTSISQGEIRNILGALDKATKAKGTLLETTENLQKLYNILGKYYDIAPKTGFQGQTKAALEGSTGAFSYIAGKAKALGGETTAVRQKAIDSVLKDALGF